MSVQHVLSVDFYCHMKWATVHRPMRTLRFDWHVLKRMTAALILRVCLSMDACCRSLLAFACYFWPSVKRLISSVMPRLYVKGKCQHVPFRLKCSKQMSVSRYLHPNDYLLLINLFNSTELQMLLHSLYKMCILSIKTWLCSFRGKW